MGADVRTEDSIAVRFASRNGHRNVVKYLIEKGADFWTNNNHAIREASENGHLEVVKYLAGKGADFRADNNYAVRYASEHRHFEIVWYLVSMGAPISVISDRAREYLIKRDKKWSRSTHSKDFSKKTHNLFANLLLGIQRLEDRGDLPLAHQAMLEEIFEGWTCADDVKA